jgi:hypothetical protein
LYGLDWFHSLLDAPTSRIILVLMLIYVSVVLLFACLYYLIWQFYYCELNFDTFIGAFDFSLEVMTTFGFSTTIDACYVTSFMVLLHSCVRLFVEGLTIGIIYSRIARPSGRASTIIFSNKGVIRRIRGKLYFMLQLCELRKHQLVEAHVRLYVVKKEIEADISPNQLQHTYLQTCSMRLNHPNDELGGMLLLMMPQVVVHELDASSPLMPPPVWYSHNHYHHITSTLQSHQQQYQQQQRQQRGISASLIPQLSYEMIKWNPPVYRNYLTGQPLPPSSSMQNNDLQGGQTIYNAEMLSSLEFPNVSRRSSDVNKQLVEVMYSVSEPPATTAGVRQDVETGKRTLTVNKPPRYESSVLNSSGYKTNNNNLMDNDQLLSPGMMKYSQGIHMATETGNNDRSSDRNRRRNDFQESMEEDEDIEPEWQRIEREMIQQYLRDRHVEIIAIVEGIDSATGGNVQARHSYLSSEIEWNKTFKYCLYEDPLDGLTTIDFDAFHHTVDAPKDAAYPGTVPSCI